MTTAGTPLKVVESAYAAILGRGDIDAFLEHFADDAVMIEPQSLPYGGTYRGKAAIKGALQSVFPLYTSFAYKPEAMATSGEWVIAYGTFAATAARTGKAISFPLAEASRVVNGKIVLINPVYSDTKALLDTLGKA